MSMEETGENRRPNQEIGMDVEGPTQIRSMAQSLVMGVMSMVAEIEGRGQTVGDIEVYRCM